MMQRWAHEYIKRATDLRSGARGFRETDTWVSNAIMYDTRVLTGQYIRFPISSIERQVR